MKRFIDLLNDQDKLPSEEQPEWAARQLERLLSESTLNAWHLGDPVPTVGQRILVGVARWSAYDLRLLDALKQAHADGPRSHEHIDILDIDATGRVSGNWDFFERAIPGIGKVLQTPVVGIWENGALTQKGSGAAGRDLVINRYCLNREEILLKPQMPSTR
jgi:hypothetical protein